jgi:hypothetical protein
MNVSSIASVVFVSILGLAACTEKSENVENKERTAACTDRTNGIACQGCCATANYSFAENKCVCKGEAVAPKAK